MQVMYKLLKVGFVFVFFANSLPVCYAAESGADFFAPCQYKQTYRYYIEKAELHLTEGQPEAALRAYEMALIVQPISDEAKEKIEYIKQLLQQKQKPKAGKMPEALKMREKAIIGALDHAEIERPPRIPVERRPAKELRKYIEEPKRVEMPRQIERKAKAPLAREEAPLVEKKGLINQAPTFMDLNPANFSNGIDESIQKGTARINSGIAPGRISGEYRMAIGFTSDDIIWKDANADHVGVPGEKNWRYLFGENQYNMYDKKIYDRLKVEAEGPITPHLSGYSEIVYDPWTFVGRKDISVNGTAGDHVDFTLKYWSNARRCLNETYRTEDGNIVNVQENKVVDGSTTSATYSGLYDWHKLIGGNKFSVPEVAIDDMSVPIRKLWVDYDKEPYHMRLFPMANQDQALTSDDPLKLSNNKVWWEESPWLDEYEPSKVFSRSGSPVKQGQWVRRLSFVAKDSDYERLTFLRGASFSANYDNGLSIESTIAAPRNLWDYYDEVSSVPGAVRIKFPAKENIKLAGIYTTKMGLKKRDDLEALNQLVGFDAEYFFATDASVYGETALSFTEIEEANAYNRDYWGAGYTLGVKSKGDLKPYGEDYQLNLSFAHMNDNFLPGLSNYRMTRNDSIYGKHIFFEDLRPENEAAKIGNGIDIDRIAFNANLKTNFLDNDLKTRLDWRDVRSDSGHFIEDVTRAEAEYKLAPKLTTKGLVRYQHLPKTTEGYDPIINAKTSYIAFTDYFSDKDIWLENKAVKEGEDPSIGTYSVGLKYDALTNLSLQGIYELTNDPLDMPRALLNSVYVTEETRDGILWDKIVPLLYDQSSFGSPPYEYYNIYKARLIYEPINTLRIEPSYVYNENKYTTTLDDNVTHIGAFIEYKPDNKLTLSTAYYYIRLRELWKDVIGKEGYFFQGHHNVFLAADYNINDNQSFTIMFGEYAGYGRKHYEERTSIGPLDTQHIVRVSYKGRF